MKVASDWQRGCLACPVRAIGMAGRGTRINQKLSTRSLALFLIGGPDQEKTENCCPVKLRVTSEASRYL